MNENKFYMLYSSISERIIKTYSNKTSTFTAQWASDWQNGVIHTKPWGHLMLNKLCSFLPAHMHTNKCEYIHFTLQQFAIKKFLPYFFYQMPVELAVICTVLLLALFHYISCTRTLIPHSFTIPFSPSPPSLSASLDLSNSTSCTVWLTKTLSPADVAIFAESEGHMTGQWIGESNMV